MGDMRMYQDERRLDFHALGREIKRKREAKGWTQEYLAQLVDRTPRSIMYFENRGQHPSLNTFYKIVTLLDGPVFPIGGLGDGSIVFLDLESGRVQGYNCDYSDLEEIANSFSSLILSLVEQALEIGKLCGES